MSQQDFLMRHGFGLVGVITCSGTAFAPFRALLRARESGSLAGMDTRSWPLYFIKSITGTLYAVMLGDMYVLLANVISVVMWMYFCLAAIGLLSREEGELAPPAPDDLGDAGLLMRKDALQLHELSKAYRKKAIRRTEQQVSLGMGLMFVLSFLTQVQGQEGLEFLDVLSVEQRLYAFSLLSMAISLICCSAPIGRLWVLIQKRDGSSVFVPYALAQCVHNLVWLGYGMILGNVAVMVPNIPGVFCTVAQILIKLRWPGDAESSDRAPDAAKRKESFAQEHSEGGLTTVAAGTASDKCEAMQDAATEATMASTEAETANAAGKSPTTLAQRSVTLPDLVPILKEKGVYEDYLKWQRDYQKWRSAAPRSSAEETA